MKIRSCSPVPTSSPRIIAFPSYIRLERRLIHSLSIGQGTFLSNPSHRPDHIEVMDDSPGQMVQRCLAIEGREGHLLAARKNAIIRGEDQESA